jgi:hypothetical protein
VHLPVPHYSPLTTALIETFLDFTPSLKAYSGIVPQVDHILILLYPSSLIVNELLITNDPNNQYYAVRPTNKVVK